MASDLSLAYTVSHNFLGNGSSDFALLVADELLSAADFVGEGIFSSDLPVLEPMSFSVFAFSFEGISFDSLASNDWSRFFFRSGKPVLEGCSSDNSAAGGGTKSCRLIKDKITVGSELERDK